MDATPLLGTVVAPEEPDEVLAPLAPDAPPLAPDAAGLLPPEHAIGPISVNKGSHERRCRPMPMVVLASRNVRPPHSATQGLSLYHAIG